MRILAETKLFQPRTAIHASIVLLLLAAALFVSSCAAPAATTRPVQAETTGAGSTTGETSAGETELPTASREPVSLITPADAKALLESGQTLLLLDVRTQEEYDAGHIDGSQLLPYDEIEARTGELPADLATPIIVYCRSGRRSAIAAETLAALGYTEIYDLGGIQDWPYEITDNG